MDRIASALKSTKAALHRRRVYNQTVGELRALSTRELNDLGIARTMITRIALEAAYGKQHLTCIGPLLLPGFGATTATHFSLPRVAVLYSGNFWFPIVTGRSFLLPGPKGKKQRPLSSSRGSLHKCLGAGFRNRPKGTPGFTSSRGRT